MKRFVNNLLSRKNNGNKNPNRFRPQLESLEERAVPAIFLLESGEMNVIGTSQSDNITIEETSVFIGYEFYQSSWGWYAVPKYEDQIQATVKDTNGNVVEQDGFNADDVNSLNILGQSGNDWINNTTNVRSTINGGNGHDTMYGGYADDVLRGGDGNDYLYGRNGDDTLHFDHIYGDNDYANGGRDNDIYKVDARPYSSAAGQLMRVTDWYGTNTLDFSCYQSGIDIDLWNSAQQEVAYSLHLDLGSALAIRNVIGTGQSDFITGNSAANVLEGRGGNDYIEGMQGNDTLRGGAGSDQYRFFTNSSLGSQYSDTMNLGTDTVEDNSNGTIDALNFVQFTRSGITIDLQSTATQSAGSGLSIRLTSTNAIRNVDGTDMADTILGNSLDNRLNGWDGNDTIRGRNGADIISGGDGKDTLSGGNGRDIIHGDNGDDTLYSDESWGDDDGQNDLVYGGAGWDNGSDDGWTIWW